jgi:hypothetical protein
VAIATEAKASLWRIKTAVTGKLVAKIPFPFDGAAPRTGSKGKGKDTDKGGKDKGKDKKSD